MLFFHRDARIGSVIPTVAKAALDHIFCFSLVHWLPLDPKPAMITVNTVASSMRYALYRVFAWSIPIGALAFWTDLRVFLIVLPGNPFMITSFAPKALQSY